MVDFILDILENRLGTGRYKRVSNGGPKGAEWAGPCPVCGGDDRFRVWPEQEGGEAARQAGVVGSWWCRRCDNRGDLIELLVFAKKMSFVEACKELRIELTGAPRRQRPLRTPPQSPEWKATVWPPPSEKWRQAATRLALEAQGQLLKYEVALKYLAGRGLPLEAAQQYGLGFLTADDKNNKGRFRNRSVFDLPDEVSGDRIKKTIWIPRGLTIPMWGPGPDDEREVHRLRFRRLAEDIADGSGKFMMLKGSSQAPMLLPPTTAAADRAVWVIVEAELCAMAVHYACQGKVGVMAALTNRGKPDAAAHKYLSAAPLILVALDLDPPGEDGQRPGHQGWTWWKKIFGQARRWPVPMGKDPGEAVALGIDLAEWVKSALPKRPATQPPGTAGGSTLQPSASEGGAAAAVEIPAAPESSKSCSHDLITFRYLLIEHKWDSRNFFPVCYRDKEDGETVIFEKDCLNCPQQPQGLRRLLRKKETCNG